MSCLICKRTGRKLFPINETYGNAKNTVKDDIIDFVKCSEEESNEYLCDDRCICSTCMNMLEDIAETKSKTWEAITRRDEQKYTPNLGNIWTSYAIQAKEDTYNDQLAPSFIGSTPSLPASRDGTPLVDIIGIRPFNEPREKVVGIREGEKTALKNFNKWRSSSAPNKRLTKNEINLIKSKSADVKKMGRDLVKRARSDPDRCISATSEMSFISFNDDNEDNEEDITFPTKRRKLELSSHEKGIIAKTEKKKIVENQRMFQCPYSRCRGFMGNLMLYTSHMIVEHSCKALYKCWNCDNRFLTSEHLQLHHETHDTDAVICGVCARKVKNVRTYQKHLNISHSFECFLCDMAFTTKREYNNHMFTNHRGRLEEYLQDTDTYPAHCKVCGAKQRIASSYEKHLEMHLNSSSKCPFCSMAFLTKKECKDHIYSNHRRKNIVECLYKKPDNASCDEPVDGNSSKTKEYTCAYVGDSINSQQRDIFRPRTFIELDYLVRKRRNDDTATKVTYLGSTTLGDEMVYNAELIESNAASRSALPMPSGVYSFEHMPIDKGKRRRPASGRSTPFESHVSSDQEAHEVDDILAAAQDSGRGTEDRAYTSSCQTVCSGVDDRDPEVGESDSEIENERPTSGEIIDESDDVETEENYLVENHFVSSIH